MSPVNGLAAAEGLASLRWWRWAFVVAAVLFWTMSPSWAKSARHFGYELWPLLLVLAMMGLSPIIAAFDIFIAWGFYKQEHKISLAAFQWRATWATCLFLNFVVILLVIIFQA